MNYRLEIKPETHVRSTMGDAIVFRIPENKLYPEGLARKKRLQRYNDYKRELWALAYNCGLIAHIKVTGAFFMRCYIPASKSYRPVKERGELPRRDLEGTPCRRKPDWDNLGKAFCDALFEEDSFIWDGRVQTLWTLKERGWIEISVE